MGAEDRQFLESAGLAILRKRGVAYEVATVDGSLGEKGLVTALLDSNLRREGVGQEVLPSTGPGTGREESILRVATCGPRGMLKAVTEICCRQGVAVEVCLEERMACGVGACLGCVCTVKTAAGRERKRVCADGPVFDGREVVWDEG